MKKKEVLWIDGFNYTKREYRKYFPNGHGNRTAIPGTVYVETFWEKLAKVGKKVAYYGTLVVLTAILLYLIYRLGNGSI